MIVFPAPLVAAIALIAFGAGSFGTHYVMRNAQNAKELAIYKVGKARMEKAQEKVDEYQMEIAALRERKPRVVRYCPPVSAPARRPYAADPGVAEERDLGPVLRACLDELIRADKLRESVK